MMTAVFTGNWWLWVVRGVLAVLFGILAFVFPDATLYALTLLFAAYAVVEGVNPTLLSPTAK